MLEQEIASIIKFILDSTGNPTPYYYRVPQSFTLPAVYFPQPELTTGKGTLSDYSAEYYWAITFFDLSTEKAYEMARTAFLALNAGRSWVPLVDTDGNTTGQAIRLENLKLRPTDECAAELSFGFKSYRQYDRDEPSLMQSFEAAINGENYKSITITEEMEEAVEAALRESVENKEEIT